MLESASVPAAVAYLVSFLALYALVSCSNIAYDFAILGSILDRGVSEAVMFVTYLLVFALGVVALRTMDAKSWRTGCAIGLTAGLGAGGAYVLGYTAHFLPVLIALAAAAAIAAAIVSGRKLAAVWACAGVLLCASQLAFLLMQVGVLPCTYGERPPMSVGYAQTMGIDLPEWQQDLLDGQE